MGTLWPDSPALPVRRPCARCRRPTKAEHLTDGHGPACAELLGLTTATPRLRTEPQTGTDLLDLLNGDDHDEPDDHWDGWDR